MGFSLVVALLMALAGILVGFLSAMFGIGGGIVMVPLLHVCFGVPAAASSGTSMFAILPTSLAGMFARLHDGTINVRLGLVVGIAGACLSPLGAWVSGVVPGAVAMIMTAFFILFTAARMFKRVYDERPSAVAADGFAPVRRAPLDPGTAPASKLYPVAAATGVVVGFLSGYLGLGGGFLVVPALQLLFGLTMKQATGTSLVSVALFSVPAFVTHAVLGHVEWVAGVLLILGALVGTQLGARAVRRVGDRSLTAMFAAVLVLSGIIMAVRELV